MAKKLPLVLAILLFAGADATALFCYREGWITNISEFASLIISGVVLAMFGAGGALLYEYIKSRGKEEVSKTIQAESEKVRIQSFIDAEASKLGHVSGVLFQPWHHRYLRFLPDRKRPSRRAILNNNTMKGWPLDDTTFDYLWLKGKIRAQRAFEMGPIFSVGKWVQEQGYTWAGEANFPRIYDLYDVPIAKLRELQTGLSVLISEPAQTFMMSGGSYVGDTQFREKVLRYSKLEIEAEALLSINHEDFYLNPHNPMLEASKQNLAYVTDKASKLLRIVTEWIQAIEEPQTEGGQGIRKTGFLEAEASTQQEEIPELTIVPTELREEEKNKEIELNLKDGRVLRHQARFQYVTLRNSGKRSVEIQAEYLLQHMIFVPLNRKPTFRVMGKYGTGGFEGQVEDLGREQAFAVSVLTDERWSQRDRITIHPSSTGETFVLFFTLENFRLLTLPGYTRIYPNFDQGIPCTIRIPIHLTGSGISEHTAWFNVVVNRWDEFTVSLERLRKEPVEDG